MPPIRRRVTGNSSVIPLWKDCRQTIRDRYFTWICFALVLTDWIFTSLRLRSAFDKVPRMRHSLQIWVRFGSGTPGQRTP